MIQQHGGNVLQYENILDFSANINPLGLPQGVKRALAGSVDCAERYPDPFCTELREKIAMQENVPPEKIVCGNGADDLIFRIAHAFRPAKAVVCAPTFSEYRRALSEVNCDVAEHMLTEENDFLLTGSIAGNLSSTLDMCIICNPNNPTGRLVPSETLRSVVQSCRENNIILVSDECFIGFAEDAAKYSLSSFMSENCIILRAFTKLYAMPGIRLGYAVCGDSSTADKLSNSGQFWSVSALAQKAGIAALDENEYVRRTVELVAYERDHLDAELRRLGFRTYPSAANFLLFRGCSGLCEKMLGEGILIRDCQNFSGLSDEFYRIAVRNHDENTKLISALRRCVNG